MVGAPRLPLADALGGSDSHFKLEMRQCIPQDKRGVGVGEKERTRVPFSTSELFAVHQRAKTAPSIRDTDTTVVFDKRQVVPRDL